MMAKYHPIADLYTCDGCGDVMMEHKGLLICPLCGKDNERHPLPFHTPRKEVQEVSIGKSND